VQAVGSKNSKQGEIVAVEYDLVVIGGGSAGLVVASAAAQPAQGGTVERDAWERLFLAWRSQHSFMPLRLAYQVCPNLVFILLSPKSSFTKLLATSNELLPRFKKHDALRALCSRGSGDHLVPG